MLIQAREQQSSNTLTCLPSTITQPSMTTQSQQPDVRSIAHELAESAVAVVESALRRTIKSQNTFDDAPDVFGSVIVGKCGNNLRDYFADHYRHNFKPPQDVEDARELTSILSMKLLNVVAKHVKLVLHGMFEDDYEDDQFQSLLLNNIRTKTLDIVTEEYQGEPETPNVNFLN